MAKVMIEAAINGNAMKKLNPHIPIAPRKSRRTPLPLAVRALR